MLGECHSKVVDKKRPPQTRKLFTDTALLDCRDSCILTPLEQSRVSPGSLSPLRSSSPRRSRWSRWSRLSRAFHSLCFPTHYCVNKISVELLWRHFHSWKSANEFVDETFRFSSVQPTLIFLPGWSDEVWTNWGFWAPLSGVSGGDLASRRIVWLSNFVHVKVLELSRVTSVTYLSDPTNLQK